jgi:hypothetical protein
MFPRFKADDPTRGNPSFFTRFGISAHTGTFFTQLKGAKTPQSNRLTALEAVLNLFEDGIYGFLSLDFGETGFLGDAGNNLDFSHAVLLS